MMLKHASFRVQLLGILAGLFLQHAFQETSASPVLLTQQVPVLPRQFFPLQIVGKA